MILPTISMDPITILTILFILKKNVFMFANSMIELNILMGLGKTVIFIGFNI